MAVVAGLVLGAATPSIASAATAVPECSPGPANCAGWYTSNVIVKWHPVNEDMSAGCDTVLLSTDGAHASTCSVHDALGWHDFTATVRIDKSPPSATGAGTSRPSDANGWFNHPVNIGFVGTDAVSGIASCTSLTYAGPDTPGTTITGACRDFAGNVSAAIPFGLRYDATPPDITSAAPTRKPDHDGWFNHPVRLSIRAGDALSGLAACGPGEVRAPVVVASCTDKAGNVGARAFGFRYDDTPPALRVSGEPADARAYVRWRARGARAIEVVRTPGERGARRSVVFRGRGRGLSDGGLVNGRRYFYTVTATDLAGNASTRRVRVVPGARLLGPPDGGTLSAPPLLRWTHVRHTRYYNVQLYRVVRGRSIKMLSTWPQRPRLQLGRTWRYRGDRLRLLPGLYRWFVWPGEGLPTERRFGVLVGRGTFRVAPGT